jgi:hypothetical protein
LDGRGSRRGRGFNRGFGVGEWDWGDGGIAVKVNCRSTAARARSRDIGRFGAGSISEEGREMAFVVEATSLVVGVVVVVQTFTNHRSRGITGSKRTHTIAELIIQSLINDGNFTIISAVVGTVALITGFDIRW